MNHSTMVRTLARGIRLSVITALPVLLTVLLAVTQPARANNLVVANTHDSGLGSLRQAINDANNNPGPDTITFAPTTNGSPIILAGAADEDGNASGDLDILDGGDLTIQGNGVANTIIDGGGIDRVFHICPGEGCANTVTFTGLTIQNGWAGRGGGISNEAGTTIVDSSTISTNTAGNGGGILNMGTLNIQNGSIIGGAGAGNQAGYGGGIYNWSGTLTVTGSTVSANTADLQGGGIYNTGKLIIQSGSSIGGTGAGNTANFGGGIFSMMGSTMVEGGTVSANMATNDGGGIYNMSGTSTVDGGIVSANTATNGAGIYNRATLNIQNSSTIGGTGKGNRAILGGGIYNHSGTTTVTGSRVLNNMAANGGGVYNDRDVVEVTSVTASCIVGNSVNSYFNNQPAQQIATGNWWGEETGPNTPGADTYGGNVDVSGHLTAPILGCATYLYLPLVLK